MAKNSELQDRQELLFFTYRSFTAAPDALLNKRGWTRVHHRIMHFIAREPGITVSGLLEQLRVSKQALHSPLKVLINECIVTSTIGQTDRRIKRLYLSEEGQRLEAALSAPQLDLLEQAFSNCSSQEVSHWQKVMRAIIAAEISDR